MSLEQTGHAPATSGVDFESVDADYFQHRQLKKGAAGWVLLVGLGVAYVISGDYAGWNFGLAQGGWGGMFLATLLMATMYLCMCFSLAEPVFDDPYRRRRLRLRPQRLRALGRLPHRHRDPHRIRYRPGGHRLLHRRLLRVAVRRRRLADLPGVLHRIHRHPHPRRRRGAEADVRHHRGGGHRPRRVHCRDGSALRLGQPVQHPADRGDRRQQLPAVRLCRGLGGDPLRDLVLPRRRRRAAGRRGNQEPQARPAARTDRRHVGASRLRRTDSGRRSRSRRSQGA